MASVQPVPLRIRRVILCTGIALGSISLYLYHMQVHKTALFSWLSNKNFRHSKKIASPRGDITDRNGIALATTRPLYHLAWKGTGAYHLTHEHQRTIEQLAKLCSLDPQELAAIEKAERSGKTLVLKHNVTDAERLAVLEQVGSHDNVRITTTYGRTYPQHSCACHIVGYLGSNDRTHGKMGLEYLLNEELTGQAGTNITITNAVGKTLHAHTIAPAAAGQTITTTIDLGLQKIAERLFPGGTAGCMLLMDAEGRLEVVLSRPGFDPSMFLSSISHQDWQQLQAHRGFINRAFTASYPPASLFKIVTLAAGLETNAILADTMWHCTGSLAFKGRHYRCSHTTGHGALTTKEAFAASCNVPFYEIGKKLSIDTIAKYALGLGLGEKTGIKFPELQGLVPTTAWKRLVKNEPWWPGETLSAAIGQSALLVTPVQIACMMHAICTGYRVTPRIVATDPMNFEPIAISSTTQQCLKECLAQVISSGTGSKLNVLENFLLYGKSGTAQVCALRHAIHKPEHKAHGYFAAHFQYKHGLPKTMVVLLEHVGTSRYASGYALNFLKAYAEYCDKTP